MIYTTCSESLQAKGERKMRTGKGVTVFFVLLLALGLLPLNVIETDVASAQGVPGFFEGEIPVQGAYLQAINTYPGQTPDSDEDGTLDKGCSWDDDGDGNAEQHSVVNPLIVNLEAQGFSPGDRIMISFKQSIYSTTINYFAFHVYGLFSSTDQLSTQEYTYTSSSGKGWPMVGPLNRVPGAIDAALGDYKHGPQDDTNSWKQGQEVENDIPQDFRIGGYQETNNCRNGDRWNQGTWWFSNGFWITIPVGAKFLFFQMAGFWNVGDSGYCRVTVEADTDGDSIPDSWEKQPIDFNKDNVDDLTLIGADYLKKDIYVEVDYMQGHRFSDAARDDVVAAFKKCPGSVEDGPIKVHIEIDDTEPIPIAHKNTIRVWSDFDTIKDDSFGTLEQKVSDNAKWALLSKKYCYHYCIFVHGIETWNGTHWTTGASGFSEVYGNDFIVSLGIGFDGENGNRDQQAGTFMHELGHNLGLRHGGIDDINYKPNYLSIMNYLFTFSKPLRNRPLTYSSATLPRLDETKLNEPVGVTGANWDWTVYSAVSQNGSDTIYVPLAVPTDTNLDWDNDGDDTETAVQANINNYPKWKYYSAESEVLMGYDDWSNLLFRFQDNKNFDRGVHTDAFGKEMTEEITWEIVQAMEEDANNMVGGPTGPVQVLDVDVPSETSNDDSSPLGNNVVFIVVAIVILAAVGAGLVLFFKKRKHQAAA